MDTVTIRTVTTHGPRTNRTLAFLALLALIVPSLVGYDIAYQLRTPALGFPVDLQTGEVLAVPQGSLGDVAGLLPGDVILGPADRSWEPGAWAPVAPWLPPSPGLYQVRVLRNAGEITRELPVVPLARTNALNLVCASAVALACWGSALLLLIRCRTRPEVHLLFVLAQAFGVLALFPLAHPIRAGELAPAGMLNLSYAAFYLVAPLLVHFYATFPVRLGTPAQRHRAFGALYGVTALALLLRLYAVARLPATDGLRDIASAIVAGEVAVAVGILLWVYVRRADADGRRRLRVIVAGNLVAALPGLLLFTVPMILYDRAFVPEWVLALCLLAVPVSYLYATIRQHLFGVDHFLNRALVYALLSLGIFLLYLGPLLLLARFVRGDLLPQALTITWITLLVSLGFQWARTHLQRWVDRLFYGGWYDYPGVVEHVSDALARTLSPERLAAVLVGDVADRMQLHPGELHWVVPPQAEAHTAIVETARRWTADADTDEAEDPPRGAAPDKEDAPDGATIPLRYDLTFRDEVRAIWVIGRRRDEDAFTADDRRILDTLAVQAEVALGNVVLVDTLRRQLAEIRAQREALARAQRRLLRSREEERARLARDLHDGPLQTLVGLRLQLELLRSPSGSSSAGTARGPGLSAMGAEVKALLIELRRICTDLRPPLLDALGLAAALRTLVEDWCEVHPIDATFYASAPALALTTPALPSSFAERPVVGAEAYTGALPDGVAVNLYRVVQEALANVARHAHAQHVRVALTLDEEPHAALGDKSTSDAGSAIARPTTAARPVLVLSIQDDGAGFTVPDALDALAAEDHFGLVGMRERAELVGGTLSITSAPGAGTTIRVHCPLAPPRPD